LPQPPSHFGHGLDLDVGGHVGDHEVTARGNGGQQGGHDPVRVFLVRDQVQEQQHQDRDEPAEVERAQAQPPAWALYYARLS
jgi:hypothetical protein